MALDTRYVKACTTGDYAVSVLMGAYAGLTIVLWVYIARARQAAA